MSALQAILDGLERKQNIVLQGPPGVGKTFAARLIAHTFMKFADDARVELVQFHQSYAYEDFVQGWRPVDGGGFRLKDGVFLKFCEKAKLQPGRPHLFIIDEINRGNLSKILGELMMLIEPDKRGPKYAMPLTYSLDGARFFVPENVFIIGLMNTADRSLAMVDYALRRRFAFFELSPKFDSPTFKQHLERRGTTSELVQMICMRLKRLNEAIAKNAHLGRGFQVGHSYFCQMGLRAADRAWYEMVVHTDIAPLIKEYWSDEGELAEQHIEDLLA